VARTVGALLSASNIGAEAGSCADGNQGVVRL